MADQSDWGLGTAGGGGCCGRGCGLEAGEIKVGKIC